MTISDNKKGMFLDFVFEKMCVKDPPKNDSLTFTLQSHLHSSREKKRNLKVPYPLTPAG